MIRPFRSQTKKAAPGTIERAQPTEERRVSEMLPNLELATQRAGLELVQAWNCAPSIARIAFKRMIVKPAPGRLQSRLLQGLRRRRKRAAELAFGEKRIAVSSGYNRPMATSTIREPGFSPRSVRRRSQMRSGSAIQSAEIGQNAVELLLFRACRDSFRPPHTQPLERRQQRGSSSL